MIALANTLRAKAVGVPVGNLVRLRAKFLAIDAEIGRTRESAVLPPLITFS